MNKPENVKKDKPVILIVDDQPQSIELLKHTLFRRVMKLSRQQMVKRCWRNFPVIKLI